MNGNPSPPPLLTLTRPLRQRKLLHFRVPPAPSNHCSIAASSASPPPRSHPLPARASFSTFEFLRGPRTTAATLPSALSSARPPVSPSPPATSPPPAVITTLLPFQHPRTSISSGSTSETAGPTRFCKTLLFSSIVHPHSSFESKGLGSPFAPPTRTKWRLRRRCQNIPQIHLDHHHLLWRAANPHPLLHLRFTKWTPTRMMTTSNSSRSAPSFTWLFRNASFRQIGIGENANQMFKH